MIAAALKKLLDASFMGMMEVFVSSDPASIHLGQKWLDQISFALKKCAIEIVLASPVALRRQWINFEAGAGWIRDVPVIPLCHSRMTPGLLPPPLNTLQAATATDANQLNLILPVLAKALGSAVPNTDFSEFISIVKSYETTTAQNVVVSQSDLLIPEGSGLTEHEKCALHQAARLVESPNEPVSVFKVREEVTSSGFTSMGANLAIKMLERKSLVELLELPEDFNRTFWAVKVTDEGWLWLQQNTPHKS